MSLKGKRVLVVGGGSGIGLAVAERAVEEGAQVVVASSNAEKVGRVAARLGNAATGSVLDVTEESAVAQFFSTGVPFDHIAFTAGDWGGFGPGRLVDLDLTKAPQGLNVRFWGAVAVAKYGAACILPGGSLTLTSGIMSHRPVKGLALATAVLGAIESLSRGLAVDLAPLRVNCVCLGFIRTGVHTTENNVDQLLRITERQLIPRPGEPSEAAEAFLYLMQNGYTTGQVLRVEGEIAHGSF